MKRRPAVWLAMVCVLLAGCGEDESPTGPGSGGAGGQQGGAGGGQGGQGAGGLGGGGLGGAPTWLELQGAACPLEGCPEPLECLQYCGFSGCGGGGTLTSCEIRCDLKDPSSCPAGQACFVVSDGPGEICQPST